MAISTKKITILIVCTALIINALSAQTILRVNVNSPCASGCDGSTWALAYPSLQTALTAFSSGEIWVAAGTYKPAGVGGDRAARFDLKSNMAVYGGFSGSENSRSSRDYATNVTILSGDLNGDDVGSTNNSENSTNVVTSFYQTGVTLNGFTIKGGNAETGDGGGFYGAVGSATVQNCIFENNYAKYGGAFNWSYSGGTSTSTGSLTVKDCIFRNNQSLFGGGIAYRLFDGVTTTLIENCLFENNYGNKGGGIYGISGSVAYNTLNSTIRGCTFKNNSAAYGGAMTFTNSNLSNNVVNCKIINNTATYGGAIYNGEGQHVFKNCLIAKNSANYGGAVETPEATQFVNCTFSNNTATYGTCFRSATAATTFTNCILWNQTAPIDNAAAVVNYCDVQGGWATGTGNINVDPLFMDVSMDNFRLQTTSPCRNVGSNAANTEANDLSGYARILDGTIDLGAYEGDGGPSNSIGILVPEAAFATAIRNLCPTCIDGLNYLTTVATSQTNLTVNSQTISDLTGIVGFSSLTTLNIASNTLSSLPNNLPNSLTTLIANNNNLSSLPTVLPNSLTTLNIANNNFSSLPTALPSGLTVLNVSNNSLTSLPTLPSSLTTLELQNNSVTCLPTLPNTLATFTFDATDINCLPNIPTALTTTMPVCAVITTHPSVSSAVCDGSTTNLTAKANSISSMTIKWQRKRAADMDYSDLAAATTYTSNTTSTYTFAPTAADNSALYRAVFTPVCSGVTTTATQLTVINTTATATTTNNNSLSFDGANDCVQIVNCSGAAFPFTDAITIEYWFKGSSTQSAVRFQPNANDYIISGWGGKHIISTSSGTSGISIGSAADDGNWHHVAMTWQKGASLGFIAYLDGVRGQRRTAENNNLPTMTSGLFLGSYGGTSEFMNGTIDEVRVWNVARTEAQIQANTCNLTLPQTGLVMYYRFNHGVADAANTVSTLGNAVQSDAYTGVLNNFNLSGASSNFSSSIPSTCPTVLPVELLDFSGKYISPLGGQGAEGNLLTWTTALEQNTLNFDIERSTDGQTFEKIGTVKAKSYNATYTFNDAYRLSPIAFYRLKINDLDGKTSYSKIISLEKDKIGRGLKVYPNPTADGEISIELGCRDKACLASTDASIFILNALGQIVFQQKAVSENLLKVDVSGWTSGVYFLKTANQIAKFIKK